MQETLIVRLVAMIEKMQWQGSIDFDNEGCVFCFVSTPYAVLNNDGTDTIDDHAPSCPLSALLREARASIAKEKKR